MKKLSLLVALALLVTVGGVYATWSYAGTNDIGDVFAEAKVTMADVELTGANGIYKVESNLVLTVDQANDDHEAKLVFSANDGNPIHLTVTFTPAANAPQIIKDRAVPTEIYFGTTTPMQYKMDAQGNYAANGTPTDIFTFTNPGNDELDNLITWIPDDEFNPTYFTYTMNQAALEAQISLSQTFVLDVKNEYDQFRAALAGNIIARVTDGTINH